MMTSLPSSGFATNQAVFAALLRGDELEAAARFRDGESASFAAFIAANKLEFHVASLGADSPFRSLVDPGALRAIEAYCAAQRERQGALLDELWALADILDGAGIPFMLLKGLYFADRFYGGVENRFSWDLDVLVRRQEAAVVDRLLRRSGYFRRSAVLLSRSLTSRFTHAFDYGNERPRFSVDLHWMLSRHPSFRVNEMALWESRQSHGLLDRRFDVLSDEYEIVSNALSTFRDIQRGAIRMRAFVDLSKVLDVADGRIDWDDFLARRRDERIAAVTVNVLALLLDLLECRDVFPGASGMIERAQDLRVPLPDGGAASLFDPGAAALPNRAWTSKVYECSRARVAVWWLVSLPFRLAVYRSGRRYANFKRRIHVLKRQLRNPSPPRPKSARRRQP